MQDAPTQPALGALALLKQNAQDFLIALSLAALCLVRRIETLELVNTGGDAATKWEFVRQWFYAHDFSHAEWNHHMTRFGVLVPAYFAQLFLGHGLRGYYATPLCACLVQVVFVYGCGKRLSGRFAGVLGALLLIYTSVMATAGSQLLPDLFTGTYGIVMTYFYIRYADAEGKARTWWLVASALTAFVGYLAKETMVFFYPGMAVALFLAGRHTALHAAGMQRWKRALMPLLLFCGVLFLGLVLETLAYRLFTQYHSRAAIVVSSHLGNGEESGRADTTFWKLFDRYLHIDKGWVVAFYIFLPCWLGVLGFAKNYRVRGMLSVVASFLFFLTFLVRSINPLLLWQRFMSRYLDPMAPFVELTTAMFVALVLHELLLERGNGPLWKKLEQVPRYGAVLVVLLCGALGASSYSELRADDHHPFTRGSELAEVTSNAYERNLPIVIRKGRGSGQSYARDVFAVYAIFIDPKLLVRDGTLPSFEQAKRVSGSMTYLVKDPKSYSAAKVNDLVDAGCAIEVHESTPSMTISPWAILPASCDTQVPN